MNQTGRSAAAVPISSNFEELQRRKMRTTAMIFGAILAAALLTMFLSAKGYLHLFANSGDNVALQKRGALPPPSLQKVAELPPPSMEKTATRIVMPDDVRAWLEHLHQTEIARVAMTNGQIASGMIEKEGLSIAGGVDGVKDALNGIDDPNSQLRSPVDKLAQMLKQMHDQCDDLQKKFDSYPAPQECVIIQGSYDEALSETTSSLGDIADHLAAGDIDKLQSMKGVSVQGIDSSTAKTDRLVGEICDKYQTKKWFSINKDIAPGGVFSMPNM